METIKILHQHTIFHKFVKLRQDGLKLEMLIYGNRNDAGIKVSELEILNVNYRGNLPKVLAYKNTKGIF